MTGAPGVPGVEGAEDNTVVTGRDPHVDICNLKGHGLRVNKVWTDKDYMSERDPAYFAVFVPAAGSGQASGADDLQLVPGSVRQMPYGSNTLYWYWLRLPVSGAPFKDYVIREVRLEGSGWSVDDDGIVTVTDETNVIPIQDGQTVEISGKQKGESAASGFTYTVDYEEGQIQTGSNVRVDTVTNSRQGIVLKKTQWDGSSPLAGAKFELKDDGGAVIGTFTSGEDGMITTAFLREKAEYTLTETQTPQGWHGMDGPMTITYRAGAGGKNRS